MNKITLGEYFIFLVHLERKTSAVAAEYECSGIGKIVQRFQQIVRRVILKAA